MKPLNGWWVLALFTASLLVLPAPAAAQNNMVWVEQISGTTNALFDVWGGSETSLFAVGRSGTVLVFDGNEWSSVPSGSSTDLQGVWGTAEDVTFVVGQGGTILQCDAAQCSSMDSGTERNLHDVWGSSLSNVFAVGDGGVILHYDGSEWSSVNDSGSLQRLNGIWTSGSRVYAVGTNGTVLISPDGLGGWAQAGNLPQLPAGIAFQDIWGRNGVLFAAGNDGLVLRSLDAGDSWTSLDTALDNDLLGIHGTPQGDLVHAVGFDGIVARTDNNGASWSSQSPTPVILRSIWGNAEDTFFTVGDGGTILRLAPDGGPDLPAEDQEGETDEDTPVAIVLGPSDSSLTYEIAVEPENGRVGFAQDLPNTVVYQPASDFNGVDSFIFRVSDGDAQDTATVRVTVNPVNDPPAADAGPNQTVSEGEEVVLDGTNSFDPDGDSIESYLWEQVSGPDVSFNATTSQTSFTAPAVGSAGASLVFLLTVSDPEGETGTDQVIVNVSSDNRPPQADAGPEQTVQESETVILSGLNSSDPDVDDAIASFQWTQESGPDVQLVETDNPAEVTFTAPANAGENGSALVFELTVTDLGGLQSTDSTVVNVVRVNRPPRADAGPDQLVRQGELVQLNGSNSRDPDGTVSFYLWDQTGGPPVSLSNPREPEPTFTAPDSIPQDGAALTFVLTVTDNGELQSQDTCVINVTQEGGNQVPTADAGDDQIVLRGDTVTLDGSGSTDPEDGIISYQWSQIEGPPVQLSDSAAVQPEFTAPEDISEGGVSLFFQLTVIDQGGLQSSDFVVVNVTTVEGNQPPIADAGNDRTADPLQEVTLDGSRSSDPDSTDPQGQDDIASYRWTQESGPPVTFTNPLATQTTFTAPDIGFGRIDLTFRLKVTDIAGLFSTDTVTVTVDTGVPDPGDDDQPPVADAGPVQTVRAGETVFLNGSNSTDDGGIRSFLWRQGGGPQVTLSDRTASRPTFTAPENLDFNGVALTFELTVTDSDGLESSDTTAVNVVLDEPPNQRNDPPVAHAGPDQTVRPGQTVLLDGSNSVDFDDSIGSYIWQQLDGPEVSLSNPEGARASFTAPDRAGVSMGFRLLVVDQGGLVATDIAIVNVVDSALPPDERNDPPVADAGNDQNVPPQTTVTLDGSRSRDPENGIAFYRWKQTEGAPVTFSDPTAVRPTFTAPEVDSEGVSLTFELTVTDNGRLRSSDKTIVNVVVSGGNRPPAADAGEDLGAQGGEAVNLDGSASEDPDGDELTYHWAQTGGVSVTLSDATAVQPTFTMPSNPDAVLVFELTVRDPAGLKSKDEVAVSPSLPPDFRPIGGSGSGDVVVATINPEEASSFDLLLSQQAVDGPGKLYFSLEVLGIPEWEGLMWFRPSDDRTPPYVDLAKTPDGFLPDAENSAFFDGLLTASPRDIGPFRIGEIQDLAGLVLIFKSWYLEDGEPFNPESLNRIQTVIVSLGAEPEASEPTIGGADAGDFVLANLDPEEISGFNVLLSQQAVDRQGSIYVSVEVLGIPAWEGLAWLRPSDDRVPPFVVLGRVNGGFLPEARNNAFFTGLLSAAPRNLDPFFVGGDPNALRGLVLIFKSSYLVAGNELTPETVNDIQTVTVAVPSENVSAVAASR